MLSVQQAKQLIGSVILPDNTALLPLAEAHGLVLAQDIFANTDIPAYPQSSMDGYAIMFDDHSKALTIAGEMKAGESNQQKLLPEQAFRIFTGAPLPEGADTVIMQEKITLKDGDIICNDEKIVRGQHVRPRGAEVQAGKKSMAAGTCLSAAAIGFLAGIGFAEIPVYAPPKLAIIITGDELQTPGRPLAFGQVYDANAVQLSAAAAKAGISSITILRAVDTPESVRQALQEALNGAGLVLVTGGVSVGDYDHVVAAANSCGIDTLFHKIKQKPGKPLFFGCKEDKLVFGLPGNPSSALTCFYEYVLLLLDRWMHRQASVTQLKALATHLYPKPAGLTHFIKAFYADGKVTPLNAQESFRLSSFAQANCFLVLDEQTEGCKAGEEVEVHLLPI
jgi:molybdopterin molybdotransferase